MLGKPSISEAGDRESDRPIAARLDIIIYPEFTKSSIATNDTPRPLHLSTPTNRHILQSQSCSRRHDQRQHWRCEVRIWFFFAPGANIDTATAKPSTAIQPFRVANAAFLSSTTSKPAAPIQSRPALVKSNPPPPVSTAGKLPTNVPLPSQEGSKGAVQYALYVDKWMDDWGRLGATVCSVVNSLLEIVDSFYGQPRT